MPGSGFGGGRRAEYYTWSEWQRFQQGAPIPPYERREPFESGRQVRYSDNHWLERESRGFFGRLFFDVFGPGDPGASSTSG